jgi:hypothetical protein
VQKQGNDENLCISEETFPSNFLVWHCIAGTCGSQIMFVLIRAIQSASSAIQYNSAANSMIM